MGPTPSVRRPGLLDGLSKILHLHQLPDAKTSPVIPPVRPTSSSPSAPKSALPRAAGVPTPAARPAAMAAKTLPASPPLVSSAPGPVVLGTNSGRIVTDYDRILDLVRQQKTIKLDEIARLLLLKEEQVAQELQTLEDNGLIEVKYPAFGEPLIYAKKEES